MACMANQDTKTDRNHSRSFSSQSKSTTVGNRQNPRTQWVESPIHCGAKFQDLPARSSERLMWQGEMMLYLGHSMGVSKSPEVIDTEHQIAALSDIYLKTETSNVILSLNDWAILSCWPTYQRTGTSEGSDCVSWEGRNWSIKIFREERVFGK